MQNKLGYLLYLGYSNLQKVINLVFFSFFFFELGGNFHWDGPMAARQGELQVHVGGGGGVMVHRHTRLCPFPAGARYLAACLVARSTPFSFIYSLLCTAAVLQSATWAVHHRHNVPIV